MFDFLAVGDAGIDTLVDLHEASTQCTLHMNTECLLCLRFADKILVDGMTSKTAYNGMNASVGAARLGVKTALFAMVGGDASGRRVLDKLREEGVATTYVAVDKKLRTNASVVLNYKGERTILVYHENYPYKVGKLPPVKWVYLTTMGKKYPVVYRAVAKFVATSGAKLAFNPGTHQLNAGATSLKPILKQTAILFLNREEAELFTRTKTNDIKKLLRATRDLGPDMVVITDGPKGSFVYDGESYLGMGILPAKVVERTGCGDGFGTAFTVARCLGKTVREALRWGTANSAGVIQKIGPQDGLLTQSAIRSMLNRYPRVQPKVL